MINSDLASSSNSSVHLGNVQENEKTNNTVTGAGTETENEKPKNKLLSEINALLVRFLTTDKKEDFNQFFKTLNDKIQQLKNEHGDEYTKNYLDNKMKQYLKQILEIATPNKQVANKEHFEGFVNGIHHLLVAALISNKEKDKKEKAEEIWREITNLKKEDTPEEASINEQLKSYFDLDIDIKNLPLNAKTELLDHLNKGVQRYFGAEKIENLPADLHTELSNGLKNLHSIIINDYKEAPPGSFNKNKEFHAIMLDQLFRHLSQKYPQKSTPNIPSDNLPIDDALRAKIHELTVMLLNINSGNILQLMEEYSDVMSTYFGAQAAHVAKKAKNDLEKMDDMQKFINQIDTLESKLNPNDVHSRVQVNESLGTSIDALANFNILIPQDWDTDPAGKYGNASAVIDSYEAGPLNDKGEKTRMVMRSGLEAIKSALQAEKDKTKQINTQDTTEVSQDSGFVSDLIGGWKTYIDKLVNLVGTLVRITS